MAENKPIILKRFNGTDYDPLFPKTISTQVFNQAGTITLFDANDKLRTSFLPSSVIGGLKFAGSFTAGSPSGPLALATFITGTATTGYTITANLDSISGITYPNYVAESNQFIGYYWIATNAVQVDDKASTPAGDWRTSPAVLDDGVAPADSGGGIVVQGLQLEAGDWLIITGYDNTAKTFTFSVINNTYSLATTTTAGIMSASDKSKLDGIAANANNYVHPTYTTYSVDTTGVDVLDTFTSNSTGHVTGIATRTLPNATTSTAGVMSAADKTKLDGIAANANNYVLPLATASTLGGIEVGYTSTETNRAVILSGNDAYVSLPRQIPAVTLNGTANNTPTFYAPTGSGLAPTASTQSRQFLQAAGNTTAPTWVDHVRINYYTDEASSTAAGVFLGDILFEF